MVVSLSNISFPFEFWFSKNLWATSYKMLNFATIYENIENRDPFVITSFKKCNFHYIIKDQIRLFEKSCNVKG